MSENLLRNFTHITIPAEIWLRRDISMQAKILWAEMRSLHDNEKGGCYASDEYLSEFIQLKRRRLYELYKELKNAGLLVMVHNDGRRVIRRVIVPEVKYTNEEQTSGNADTSCAEKCTSHRRNAEKCTASVRNPALLSTPSPYIHYNKEEKSIARTTEKSPHNSGSALDSYNNKLETTSDYICSVINFSFEKHEFLNISQKDINTWKEIYPDVNVERELKAMGEWLLSNPSKAKSKKLYRKFITNWLAKEQDKNSNQKAYRESKGKTQQIQESKAEKINAEMDLLFENRAWFKPILAKIYHNISDTSDYVVIKDERSESERIYYKDTKFKELVKHEIKKRKLL